MPEPEELSLVECDRISSYWRNPSRQQAARTRVLDSVTALDLDLVLTEVGDVGEGKVSEDRIEVTMAEAPGEGREQRDRVTTSMDLTRKNEL